MKPLKKADVLLWLNNQHEEWAGKFMDAEEAGNEAAMAKAQEQTDLLEDLIQTINKYPEINITPLPSLSS